MYSPQSFTGNEEKGPKSEPEQQNPKWVIKGPRNK